MAVLLLRLAVLVLLLSAGAARAAALDVRLVPDPQNPTSPQMGDRMKFVSTIENRGAQTAEGLVAWISLLRIDPGQEQPMDLEDWSAHKAVTQAALAPGERIDAEWPMRLIQAGTYRVVISVVERHTPQVITSPFVDFPVRRKPVVESRRVLPVAFGVPLALAGLMLLRLRRNRR